MCGSGSGIIKDFLPSINWYYLLKCMCNCLMFVLSYVGAKTLQPYLLSLIRPGVFEKTDGDRHSDKKTDE